LIDSAGNIKICDFGISEIVDENNKIINDKKKE